MFVSIFNDVIGPVMRGPSSSHCAAALRIGRLARDLMGGEFQDVLVQFDRNGSLPTTHESQGSDMGLCGGLLGWEAADQRLPGAVEALGSSGKTLRIEIVDSGDPHPNTYRLTLANDREQHHLRAVSTGGGMVEVVEIDAFPVSIAGDYYETLLWLERADPGLPKRLADHLEADGILLHNSETGSLLQIKTQRFLDDQTVAALPLSGTILNIKRLAPVLPVLSRRGVTVPFHTCDTLLQHDGGQDTPLWEYGLEYEMARGGLRDSEVLEKMGSIVKVLRHSVARGVAGTSYPDRLLGYQCGQYRQSMEAGRLLDAGALNRIVLYVSALMEVKSSLGVIVAAPTAGASAAVPGAILGMADALGLTDDSVVRAFLASGLIGVFIATGWTFAAEVGGCQAECGAAASMAAAGLVTLADGTLRQGIAAASMALQGLLGLICDPVANRVEVPCLGKNVLAASNAVCCANMALADFDPVISLDEVIETARRVGGQLPRELRCTGLGGLAITPTSRRLEGELAMRKSTRR
jgi:L-serine dehydratase